MIDLACNKDEEDQSESGSVISQALEEEAQYTSSIVQKHGKPKKQTNLRGWMDRAQQTPSETILVSPRAGKYPSIDEMPTDFKLQGSTLVT